jgi:hypothetical protein
MQNQRPRAEISAAERAEIFREQYDAHFDAASALPDFVIAAGDYLSQIVGAEDADAGMAQLVKGVVESAGGEVKSPGEWRTALVESRANCFSEWKMGAPLHDLAAYAEYGIVLHDSEDPEELSAHMLSLLKQAEDLDARTPITQWALDPRNALSRLVEIARNRWSLDNDQPIEPVALAFFGGVSEGRVRNMMSGSNRVFSSESGRIPALEARKWLVGRPEFWNSIWREQSLPQYDAAPGTPLERAIFVPVARDGSTFHLGLRRGSTYAIGKKGDEEQVADFGEALTRLQRMPVPYWRRPNASGNWGNVAGVRWERVDAMDFKINPGNSEPVADIDPER